MSFSLAPPSPPAAAAVALEVPPAGLAGPIGTQIHTHGAVSGSKASGKTTGKAANPALPSPPATATAEAAANPVLPPPATAATADAAAADQVAPSTVERNKVPLLLDAAADHAAVDASEDVEHHPKRQRIDGGSPFVPGNAVEMVLLGRYGDCTGVVYNLDIIRQLGKGGNGNVWRVRRVESSSSTAAKGGGEGGKGESTAPTAAAGDGAGGSGKAKAAARAIVTTAAAGEGVAAAPPICIPLPDRDLALKVVKCYEDFSLEYRRTTTHRAHAENARFIMHSDWDLLRKVATSPYVIDSYGYGRINTGDGQELYCLLLELAEHGSLQDYVRPGGVARGLDPVQAHQFTRSMLKGVSATHNVAHAFHRDLKCSNFLLTGDKDNPGLKLTNFGCAHDTEGHPDALCSRWKVGTPAFAAPQQQEGCLHDSRVDTYQLGLTWVQTRFGEVVPFPWLWGSELGVLLSAEEQKERRQDLLVELERPDCPYINERADGIEKLQPGEMAFLRKCLEPEVAWRETVMRLLLHFYALCGPYATDYS